MMMCRHKLEEQEEIMMESDEEGLLATNLIEELVGSELGFQLRYMLSPISCHVIMLQVSYFHLTSAVPYNYCIMKTLLLKVPT